VSRRAILFAAIALVLVAAPASAGNSAASWALPQIKLVTAHGLMGGKAAGFRPDDPLTAGDLADLVGGLFGKDVPTPIDPSAPVTIRQLDAQLVRGLGLLPTAREFSAAIRTEGLAPQSDFGTEVAARLIGLRVNHPAAQDSLELSADSVATRAEAAYSAAHILAFTGGEVQLIQQLAATFQPTPVTGFQRAVLQTATSLVGYPYIWGGTSESPQDPFGTGTDVPGGFDCSGLVWRVYKLQSYPGATGLAATIKGRTTYAMSGEVPRAKRIAMADLQPGDVLFFGANGPKSTPAQVDHAGIYLGSGWFVQSSDQGVALAPLTATWYAKRFAWARRPLAEAGLE
jgi:cell wall-associated NlpC family hydrolase